MRQMLRAAALISVSTCAAAAPTIDPMFGNHAVIQRDQPIHVRGTAGPGDQVAVALGNASRSVTANRDGDWSADLPPMAAGGPYRLTATGADGSMAASDDIMLGDVWLCSGQSNMEWPLAKALNGESEVAGANDPQLRLMKVPKNRVLDPQVSLARGVGWRMTEPASAKDFSAACYFMARSLRQSHQVAIGAIDSSWGGTAIASWMDENSVRATGGAEDIELLRAYRRDPEGTVRGYNRRWSQWWQASSGDRPGTEPWRASDRLTWTAMPRIALWETWGDPKLADFNGAMWARTRFTLTAQQAAELATLSLGAIDDFDRTYLNGEAIGTTFQYDKPREYAVGKGLLKAGVNEVMVYVLDTGGGGGFWSDPELLKLKLAGGAEVPLAQGWQYSIVASEIGTPPLPPWDAAPGITTLYNGMVAPLGSVRLKGVAWYQGEADVGKAGYDDRLMAMIDSWSRQFGNPSFLIVGLAGFGQPVAAPVASSWAALMDEQRQAVDRANDGTEPRAALVSAIDIGEKNDIHPPNKQELGRRLALAAEEISYRSANGAVGPRPISAHREDGRLVVELSVPLKAYGGSLPLGFELCAETQDSCRYVDVEIEGSRIIIPDDGRPATRIRYAWADFPLVNTYGPHGLPLPSFELGIR